MKINDKIYGKETINEKVLVSDEVIRLSNLSLDYRTIIEDYLKDIDSNKFIKIIENENK